MKILITGGAGFIGSHVAEFYAKKGDEVTVFDNLSRAKLLLKDSRNAEYNWNHLKQYKNVKLVRGDITSFDELNSQMEGADTVLHAAAQTAVTTSVTDPATDFRTNALGTFNVVEAARRNDVKNLLYCSTNKVYGANVNNVPIEEKKDSYAFSGRYSRGVTEDFGIDLCEHTPYGSSKLTGDIYVQDYSHMYGLKTGVFRMSCIYGTRQFGVEDQGWVSWFTIATLTDKDITIYGNGKQVRDVLFVQDLVNLYDKFVNSNVKQGVFNTGGGVKNTLSLLQLLDLLNEFSGKKSSLRFDDWRPSDQKVYISDISKAKEKLGWEPKITPKEGVKMLYDWVSQNKQLFK